ncbi:hypothetical protein EK904_003595 [Melospiza melodia maxima]|nr:hypothetical protein EK904_003595 [Melospiza melodia maxima]
MGLTSHCCHPLHIHLPLSPSPPHRDRIARIGLGVILNLAKERDIPQLAQSLSGILEHMFKHTEETCFQLISDGGLDTILYWCRWTDPAVLRHCAMALANCAMYGGQANQRLMIEKKAAEWLFPLAFSKDDELIRLHACLAITVLATNKEIEKEVERSGTLALVEPFIASLDPEQFACRMLGSSDNIQGRTAQDLQRLVPLLDSSRLEAQCIAAFYLCTEAAIKARQKKTQVKANVVRQQMKPPLMVLSPLATSLLKVHLQLHGFSVFIDVEKLEAGKFEDKLIQSVLSARNFVLVLSPNALDKCMEDPECKDWVHKEIVTALNSGKNIVPVTDHFEWPDPETLPKDMRAVLKFNGIMWSHEYQEATIDKIIRFLQGRSSRDSSAGSENGLDCLHSLGQS